MLDLLLKQASLLDHDLMDTWDIKELRIIDFLRQIARAGTKWLLLGTLGSHGCLMERLRGLGWNFLIRVGFPEQIENELLVSLFLGQPTEHEEQFEILWLENCLI